MTSVQRRRRKMLREASKRRFVFCDLENWENTEHSLWIDIRSSLLSGTWIKFYLKIFLSRHGSYLSISPDICFGLQLSDNRHNYSRWRMREKSFTPIWILNFWKDSFRIFFSCFSCFIQSLCSCFWCPELGLMIVLCFSHHKKCPPSALSLSLKW